MKKHGLSILFVLLFALCAQESARAEKAGGFLQMTIISGADRILDLYREFTAYTPAQREALRERRRQNGKSFLTGQFPGGYLPPKICTMT
ncbi:MAG: hypothetical protein HFE88_01590 [Acutalibacter sp.]|nr:hypothetical protein [Acutalibacter sp.]